MMAVWGSGRRHWYHKVICRMEKSGWKCKEYDGKEEKP